MRISDWSSDVCSSDLLAFRTLWRQSRMAASVGARNAKVKSFAASRHDAEAIAGGVPIAATLPASRHPPMPRRPPMAALQDLEAEAKPAEAAAPDFDVLIIGAGISGKIGRAHV